MIGEGFAGIGAYVQGQDYIDETLSEHDETGDAKMLLLEKKLQKKGTLLILKQNHMEKIAQFFSLLPVQKSLLFDPRKSIHLNLTKKWLHWIYF